jgi:hypothetical protein
VSIGHVPLAAKLVSAAVLCALVAPAAALSDAPPGATARCTDGTYSFSATRSGTCSHHGGVADWLAGVAPARPAAGTGLAVSTAALLAPRTKSSDCRTGVLPDRACSPGAADPRVTQANIQSTICVSGYTTTVRNVPTSEKNAVYREYGITHRAPYSYEVDHIVSLELGGSNDIANLYPESYAGPNGARVKDTLENRLHAAVCHGQITLAQAQTAIATNWLAASTQYRSR